MTMLLWNVFSVHFIDYSPHYSTCFGCFFVLLWAKIGRLLTIDERVTKIFLSILFSLLHITLFRLCAHVSKLNVFLFPHQTVIILYQ